MVYLFSRKLNAPQLLEQELHRKRKKCMIGTGAMSDPYLHLKKELMKLVRRECESAGMFRVITSDNRRKFKES